MSKTEVKQTENKTKSEKFSVPCVKCNGATKHQVLASIDVDGEAYDQGEEWSVNWVDHYQVIQCGGCESISFRHTSWFSEDADPMSGDSGETERLYPKRGLETLPTKSYHNVPSNLRRIYSELIDCFNNDSPTLCAAGLRAIVEGICAERGILDGPVEEPGREVGQKLFAARIFEDASLASKKKDCSPKQARTPCTSTATLETTLCISLHGRLPMNFGSRLRSSNTLWISCTNCQRRPKN